MGKGNSSPVAGTNKIRVLETVTPKILSRNLSRSAQVAETLTMAGQWLLAAASALKGEGSDASNILPLSLFRVPGQSQGVTLQASRQTLVAQTSTRKLVEGPERVRILHRSEALEIAERFRINETIYSHW